MKKFLIIMLVLIVLAFAIHAGNRDEGRQQTTGAPTVTAEENTLYHVGDEIKLGAVLLKVNKVEVTTTGEYTAPQPNNQWIDINMTIANTGSQQEYITTVGQMYILDSENNQYQVSVTDKRLSNPGSMGLDGAIVAGAKKTDWVGFEVPQNAKGLKLQYNASFYNNKNVLIDLGL